MQQCVIHCSSHKNELSDDSLNKLGLLLCQWCALVFLDVLDLGSMVNAGRFRGTLQCILNVLVHAADDFTGTTVPVKMHPHVLLSLHITCQGGFGLQRLQEVVKVLFVLPFDSENVDNKGKLDRPCLMAEWARCEVALATTKLCWMIHHVLTGNPPGFRQTTECSINADMHTALSTSTSSFRLHC